LSSIGRSVAELAAMPAATENATAIKRLAHKIKGMTSQIGAVRASAVAQHIETETVADIEAAVQSLQTAVSEAEQGLKAHLESLRKAPAVAP
jgi:HPt (histidine-containing phosphotransfer) domain-containing protein